ncbi:uncharacterized protein NECHADRAFT_88084 [Fusarium vanettenii 77-13-4]|uniref:Protein kinase domain-containing protein n=1 Tax=Fusarium vanettenii (strain ATCC MYA-4622 / CBS 123669 / FGSC 9596 / NRRL 45880 / 77-13-4) TaxID=660122 RepID=C7ZL72_FUSV7|nr:uncharacterized protein NECHADRAFT_88084 [Fusarium vanettenii 77-13-4]EEU35265.1 hypothetical protein NECHADRAFT_88084 [Fusarium vanettenii 77-13-4]
MTSPLQASSSLANQCLRLFEECLTRDVVAKGQWAQNRGADFILWVDRVGVLSGQGAPYCSRFKDQGPELTLIQWLLTQLRNCLEECLGDEEDHLGEVKRSIDTIIRNLISVAVAVRQTGRKFQLIKADKSFDASTFGELRTHLKRIILIGQSGLDQNLVDHRDHPTWWQSTIDGKLTNVQNRLLEANLRRRHRFQHAQMHSMDLASRSKDSPPTTPNIEPIGNPPTLSLTSASTPQDTFKSRETRDLAPATNSRNSSMADATDYPKLALPKNPEFGGAAGADMGYQQTMKCPCCCEAIPNNVYPYICFAEHCPVPHALYRTRVEWEKHLQVHHSKKWKCQICDTSTGIVFSSIDHLRFHVAEEHLESFPEDLLDTVSFWPSVPSMGLQTCPLCRSTGPVDDLELIEHVLKHTHDFSLRSLPWADLSQPSGYFTTNVYFDLGANDGSLATDGQSDPEVSKITGHPTDEGYSWTYRGDGLPPLLDEDGESDLYILLHRYCIEGCDGKFWTERLLRQILTEERVGAELRASHGFSRSDVSYYLDLIFAQPTEERPETYLRIFALLVLASRVSDIGKFITENVCDKTLPLFLDLNSSGGPLSLRGESKETLKCFQGWNWDQKQNFAQSQWRLIFPFLGVSAGEAPRPIVLEHDIIRPWRDTGTESDMGMFETVSCVEIHPTAHSFEKILSDKNFTCGGFAIKTLRKKPLNKWLLKQDLDQLAVEITTHSQHLIPILGSFCHQGQWSLILPRACCTLRHLLEQGDTSWTPKRMRWGYQQLYSIMDGVRAIHSYPRAVRPDFAIHGHIDLDTIICYGEPEILEHCVLVISHFPLSISQPSLGTQTSPVFRSPTYRPPEWDLEGGCVSESSDIWSLGCAYLEFITWLLGGRDLLSEFQDARQSPYLDGTLADRFYTFMSSKEDDRHVLRLKTEITEGNMLLALPSHRSSSLHLRQWFNFDLDEMFYFDGKPEDLPSLPTLDFGVRLSPFWKEKMATGSQVELPMHNGGPLIYLTPDQLRNPRGS